MIGYVTLGTNDLNRAGEFYGQLFSVIGIHQLFKTDTQIGWGPNFGSPILVLGKPFDGEASSVGNGVMVALKAENRELIKRLYDKAIELGASAEGEPGLRGKSFFAGYFRDLDGNKLNFYCYE